MLPVYVAYILGHVLGLFNEPELPIFIGFMMPFFVGLIAVVAILGRSLGQHDLLGFVITVGLLGYLDGLRILPGSRCRF